MAVWSVYVLAGPDPLDGHEALDRLGEAVAAQPAHLGFSVAGGAKPSVFVSVEAADVTEARRHAESIVDAALASIDRTGPARAALVYDADGVVVFEAS
jgi:hypothetical protein